MGLMSFFKDAGEKLFGHKDAAAASSADAATPAAQGVTTESNRSDAQAIADYIAAHGLSGQDLRVSFDGATGTVTVSGVVADQATKEKILLCCGNVRGVAAVDDQLTVEQPADESRFHTVARGDTLSAIAKQYYGNAGDYMKIFEANKPMLGDPNKIYPGQSLRIPA